MDSGRICIDGRPTGTALPRRPVVGDVIVLELDLDQHQASRQDDSDISERESDMGERSSAAGYW